MLRLSLGKTMRLGAAAGEAAALDGERAGAQQALLPAAQTWSGRAWALVLLAHAIPVGWLFGRAFVSGWLLYFRDLSTTYAPWYVFAADALRRGVWPLWNPTAHAGEPFLLCYPVDLVLLALGGWRAPLGVGPALHLLLALVGGSWLARRLGMGPWGAWLAGMVYGLGGTLLSLVNLVQLFEAAAWAPWWIATFLDLVRQPSRRRTACLAALGAVQLSTLGLDIVLQTAFVALVLAWRSGAPSLRLSRRQVGALTGAGLLTLTLAAPVLLGARAVLRDSARERGFSRSEALAFSEHPLTLPELALPLWLGNPRAFSDADYWGRAFFPDGYPYLLSLYLGAPVLLLAAQARRRRRLWVLAGLGLLVALGSYGPLGLLPEAVRLPLRGPQKAAWTLQLALALLAGFGLERRLGERLRGPTGRLLVVLPAAAYVLLAFAVERAPELVRLTGARLLPQLLDDRAAAAARWTWPSAWWPASLLTLLAALALVRGARWTLLAGLAAAIAVGAGNASVVTLAPPSFYTLRENVAGLLASTREATRGRLFAYGVGGTPGLRFEPVMNGARSDVWLYYLDRQSLLPLTQVFDGWDGALGEDRTGFASSDAALEPEEAVPARFREVFHRLQQAGVRWVASFEALPIDLVSERGRAKFPEVVPPLRLYEVRGSLPRAFFVPQAEVVADRERTRQILADPSFDPRALVLLASEPPPSAAPSGEAPPRAGGPLADASVSYEPLDAHTLRVVARTPPGYVVVLDSFGPDWTAEDGDAGGRPLPVLRANGRYRALRTPGGRHVFLLRFRPRWRDPALIALGLGVAVLLALLARGGRGSLRGARTPAC